MKNPRAQFDAAWKEAIRLYFQSFLEFFFPEISADIDWTKGYQTLDKELQQAMRGAKIGRRSADCLLRITRLDGREEWLLIHVEVQSQHDVDFARRMALYNERISVRYGLDVVSLAILGDESSTWRPSTFFKERWGFKLSMEWPMAKLVDYPLKAAQPQNPFSWLVAAHRQALRTKNDPPARYRVVIEMLRGLYTCGLEGQAIKEFFHLVDWVLVLPTKLSYDVKREVSKIEEANQVTHLASYEKIAYKEGQNEGRTEGRTEGRAQGIRTSILRAAKIRWNLESPELESRLASLPTPEDLDQALNSVLTLPTAAAWLATLPCT